MNNKEEIIKMIEKYLTRDKLGRCIFCNVEDLSDEILELIKKEQK